ncbi:MAG TPA: LysR substrate-binding domain-containing protein [Paucimonas sp.]|nr:LysR substrate-binding domain-containing protein [Paucimonas sp.]
MERLAEMMTFAKVVETKSFSEAARVLQTSKSLVSKQISQLEAALGVRLLHRTTRSMSLTEIGAAYYEHCARIAQEIDAADATVTQLQAVPRGTLRLTSTVVFATMHLAPAIQEFLRRYPQVEIELEASDRVVDLVEEGYDLAIRISDNPAPNMVARKIAPVRWVTCAAPAYLEQHGTPRTPQDLSKHNCLLYHGLPAGKGHWRYRVGGKEVLPELSGNCRVNNSEVLLNMARGGMGIIVFPTYMIGPDLQSGRLREILADFAAFPDMSLYAMYAPNRYLQPKVRAFIDFLLEYVGPEPAWEKGLPESRSRGG